MRCVQVAVKPYLIFENGYEYTPPGIPKPPTASQVPDVIQGAVEMSIFNPGTQPITVRPHPKNLIALVTASQPSLYKHQQPGACLKCIHLPRFVACCHDSKPDKCIDVSRRSDVSAMPPMLDIICTKSRR